MSVARVKQTEKSATLLAYQQALTTPFLYRDIPITVLHPLYCYWFAWFSPPNWLATFAPTKFQGTPRTHLHGRRWRVCIWCEVWMARGDRWCSFWHGIYVDFWIWRGRRLCESWWRRGTKRRHCRITPKSIPHKSVLVFVWVSTIVAGAATGTKEYDVNL